MMAAFFSEDAPLADELRQLGREVDRISHRLMAETARLTPAAPSLGVDTYQRLADLASRLRSTAGRVDAGLVELGQLRALADTIQMINATLDVDQVLIDVMDTVVALTGVERGYIALVDSQAGELRFRVARDRHQNDIDAEQFTVSQTVVHEVAESGEPVLVRNALDDPNLGTQDSIMLHAPRSILCVPLIFRGRVTGVIYADSRQASDLFGERELALLIAFANQAAVAIQNARLFNRVRQTLEEITEMNELMDDVFTAIASGVITIDNRATILTINPAAERILGVPQGQAVGRSIYDVFPHLFAGFEDRMRHLQTHDEQQVIEVESVIAGRGAVNLVLKLTPLKNAQNAIYGMAVVVDDLTAIKQRDAKLHVVQTYLPPSLVNNIQSIDSLGLGGDEREISVVFADVRNFTAFSEQLPPEELLTIINRYLVLGTDAIQLHDGIVDKYMGDAVIGLFNTQLNPQPDHPERAVRAALSMLYDLRELQSQLAGNERLSFGIGIDTGTAMLGNVGSPSRKEFTAIGPPVNVAKRLQENAAAGEIVISTRTYQRVDDLFAAEPVIWRPARTGVPAESAYRVVGLKR